MFRLNVSNGGKKIAYKQSSLAVKFLIDGKNIKESLKSAERFFNTKIPGHQKSAFIEQGSRIRITNPGKPDEIIIYKIKPDENFSADYFRDIIAGLPGELSKQEVINLHIFIPEHKAFADKFDDEVYYYQTFIEGLYYGNYSFNYYKSEDDKLKDLNVIFYSENDDQLIKAIKNSQKLMQGVNFTRDLENEPASGLTPQMFADRIIKTLSRKDISVTVWDDEEIKKNKMGGLLGVGQGSDNTPRFIIIDYKPSKNSEDLKTVALVGKGVTFDSGGISIKPAQDMGEMKADMSGAAVVAGSILTASLMNLPVNIIGIIPAAENLLSGKSYRPGDIIRTASGKTVEVENTDAEGRIILADALDYASKQKPDYIIDLATLTGACVVALGSITAGLFTKDKYLRDLIYSSGQKTFERVWELPLWQEYGEFIKSDVADIKNLGGKWGGAITAAKFLEHFVDKDIPWAHLDIAGPTFPAKIRNYDKKYMTGFGVRLIVDMLMGMVRTDKG